MERRYYYQDFRNLSGDWFFAWFTENEELVTIAFYPYKASHDGTLRYYSKGTKTFDDIYQQFVKEMEFSKGGELYSVKHTLLS